MQFQIMRRELAVLHDQISKISKSARELYVLANSVFQEQNNGIQSSLERIRNTEDEVENIRKKITKDVIEIGNSMSYREDILRTAYIIDEIVGYISGIAFRLSNLKITVLKQAKCDKDIITLIEKVAESICKLNEMARTLSINHRNIIELAHEIQKLEREVDSKYRNILIKAFDGTENTRELILFKDTVEAIEETTDKCQEASDSFTIPALSL
ncbi:MAG TPA: DUF47 family protein [Nitrososphaeraceae archaeon]|nr:DUF47 family protein [Nitrososphaeraceae archaeon]